MKETVGQLIARAREEKGLSKRELARLAKISDTELGRIESGQREIPNPKTLRKISKYIGLNYNDLMYEAGLGFQVTTLNPFLKTYYSKLTGEKLQSALINTIGSRDNWVAFVKSLKETLETEDLNEEKMEMIKNTIEDTEYQINTAEEIIRLLESAMTKERIENAKRNEK